MPQTSGAIQAPEVEQKRATRKLTKRLAWLQENGREMPWRARPSGFPQCRAGHCFQNCANLAIACPQFAYVEGLALVETCSDERNAWHSTIWRPDLGQFSRLLCHAWLLDREGYVIDPTWSEGGYYERYRRLYLGTVIPTDI